MASSRPQPSPKPKAEPGISGTPYAKRALRKRYNKMVIIDLEKRAILRDLIKRHTTCQHKQIYTQANAISRRMTTAYEEGKITEKQALKLILEAHHQMTHMRMPKEVVADEMNKQLDKIEDIDDRSAEITMANVSRNSDNGKGRKKEAEDQSSRYSESYWAEVI